MADIQVYRSRNALLGGVCAGIAERIDADAIVVRIFAVLLACVTFGLAVIGYAMMWVRLPLEPEGPEPFEVRPESAESHSFGTIRYRENGTILRTRRADELESKGLSIVARLAVAVGLMLLFLIVSANVSPLVPGTKWWQFWPIAFMIVGLCLIVVPMKSSFEAAWHAAGIALTSASATIMPVVLDIAPWSALVAALSSLWPLVAISFVLLVTGFVTKRGAIVTAASILFAVFCLLALYLFVFPGASETMTALANIQPDA